MSTENIITREKVTEKILFRKVALERKWDDLAKSLDRSVEWTVAACLGQMQLSAEQSEIVGEFFGLSTIERRFLQQVPYKNPSGLAVPSDPLLYRLHEALGVYGPAVKEVIHEEFGDGIMSAIDFSIKVEREPHENGDRVKLIWSGKFLPYKEF